MFSVRGDGLTTATTDKAVVSAFVATASAGAYAGTVLEVQTTGTAAGGGFKLLHVSLGLGGGGGEGVLVSPPAVGVSGCAMLTPGFVGGRRGGRRTPQNCCPRSRCRATARRRWCRAVRAWRRCRWWRRTCSRARSCPGARRRRRGRGSTCLRCGRWGAGRPGAVWLCGVPMVLLAGRCTPVGA
jgi:hypothetical protein